MVRDKRIDIAKAIGIILVVLGHAGMPHSSILFRFHMALFFALSGYCFRDKHIASLKNLLMYIKNKIIGLYIPFIVFNGITLLLRSFLIEINIYTNNERFLEETFGGNAYGLTVPLSLQEMKLYFINILKFQGESQLGGATWFLRVLFGITICWAIINFFFKTIARFDEHERFLMNVIVSGMSLWIAYIWMKNDIHFPMQFETVVTVYTVYTIGYYLQTCYKNRALIQDLIIAILTFGILLYCDMRCSINGWNSNVN